MKIKKCKKTVDKIIIISYNNTCQQISGRLAQLGEHLPYKQEVIGSSPIVPTTYFFGLVVQLVRTLACHARGRGFEPHSGRQFFFINFNFGQIAQLVEQGTENPRVGSSILSLTTIKLCGSSSVDRAPPCQGGGRGFEPRLPLHLYKNWNIFNLYVYNVLMAL